MLYTIIIVLLIIWLLGGGIPGIALYSSASVGGLIHLILVIALILLVVQLLTGRRQL